MNIPKYFEILKNEGIARRYAIMNSFDGTLTILGVMIAMYFAGVTEARLVIVSSMGVAIALAVSGIWSAYAAEKAERRRALMELERHLMRKLNGTKIGKKTDRIAIMIAMVNGLSPFLISLVLILPFLIFHLGIMRGILSSITLAFYASMALILMVLFMLGVLIGKIGRGNLLKSGITMASAGIVVGLINYGLEFTKVI